MRDRAANGDRRVPREKFSEKCWTHDLDQLLDLAGLTANLKANPAVYNNWGVVKDWNETRRYELMLAANAEMQTKRFYQAVTDPVSGVLQWIKGYW